MWGKLAVLFISLSLAYSFLKLIKKEPIIYRLIYVTYLVWHLPLIISIILPFDYFKLNEWESFLSALIILLIIHFILLSGILAYRKYKTHYHVIFHSEENKNKGKYFHYPMLSKGRSIQYRILYVPLAYLSVVFSFLDSLIRGFSLNFGDLANNRSLLIDSSYADNSNIYSFLAGLSSGFIYYCLFSSLQNKKSHIKIRIYLALPYLIGSFLALLKGSQYFLLPGLIIILIKLVIILKPKILSINLALLCSLLMVVFLATLYQASRAATDTLSFQSSLSISGVVIDENKLLTPIFKQLTWVMPSLYVLYLYLGVIFDAFYAAISSIPNSIAPLGSLTLPVIYRRFQGILDLPSWENVRLSYHSAIEDKFHVFPRVWSTMFSSPYLEGTWIYLCLFIITLMYIHFNLVKNYLLYSYNADKLNNLILFYTFMMIGLIILPTYDTGVFVLILATIAKPYINKLFRAKT